MVAHVEAPLLIELIELIGEPKLPLEVTYATMFLSLLKLAGLAALLGAGRLLGVQTSPPVSAAKTSQSAS
jgi:hypothetical protein